MAFDPSVKRKEQGKLDVHLRTSSFDEVVIAFSKEEVIEQTKRCLSCPKPKCEEGCPIHLPIRDMIKLISEGKEKEAFDLINEVSPINGICSIVCDHASQCEGHCIRGLRDEPVTIGPIHRYVAYLNETFDFHSLDNKKEQIAIIGAGPSGLTVAYELRKAGYQVTVYEKEDKIGGVPLYGIPSFRLNEKDLDISLSHLDKCGINFILSKQIKLEDIIDQYDAIYLALGTQKGKSMGLEGEDLEGVITGETFLKDIKIFHNDKKYEKYQNCYVVGGGNVAMDVSRTLTRLNKKTTIVYRRSIEEAPCRKDELEEAREEGVILHFLTNPVRFIGNDKLEKIELIQMELGEPDASNRRRPVEIKGSNYLEDADLVIMAIGSELESQYVNGITLNHRLVEVNENYQTNIAKVFAGGDIVTGSNTVVHAIKAGKDAAHAIIEYLTRK